MKCSVYIVHDMLNIGNDCYQLKMLLLFFEFGLPKLAYLLTSTIFIRRTLSNLLQ